MGIRVSRMAKRFQKKCANPNCDNMFWANGTQKYCDGICQHFMLLKRMYQATKKWRQIHGGIKINQLKKFGYFISRVEK